MENEGGCGVKLSPLGGQCFLGQLPLSHRPHLPIPHSGPCLSFFAFPTSHLANNRVQKSLSPSDDGPWKSWA